MKTLIELYVNEQYDDLLASYVFKPERVVFICTGAAPSKLVRQSIVAFLKKQREDMQVEFISFGNKTVGQLFSRIDAVCKKYPDCAVELTGGSAAVLIAAESYCAKRHIKAFFFDHGKNRFVSIRGMRSLLAKTAVPKMDVNTIIAIGGALVTGTGHSTKQLGTNEECVRKVLDIYSANLSEWNANSEYLQYCCKHYYDSATQLFSAPATIRASSSLYIANRRLLHQLEAAGAISELNIENDSVSFRFRNSFLREILTTVGMCLELLIYVGARDSCCFDDVSMSVVFDWDGVVHTDSQDTVNEIDVIMTKGLSPIFVSCKSARPDTRDLYEIWYLARRFGGSHAKAVIATAVPLSADSWATYIRARDMGITVIEKSDIEAFGSENWLKTRLLTPKYLSSKPKRRQ